MTRRVGLVVAVAFLPACQFCEDVDQFLPQGSFEPAVLDLGPITTGVKCPARLGVHNGGNADLEVTQGSAALPDKDGNFVIQKVPALIRLGATEEFLVDYTAGDAIGEREGTNVEIVTNDPDNDGILRASISAFISEAPVPLAVAECDETLPDGEEPIQKPCTALSFGGVAISDAIVPIDQRPGRNLEVRVINDGNADLTVSGAALSGGNGDFAVVGARRGSQVVPFPVVVPPGRSGDCGDATGNDNVVIIDVRFAPVNIGASAATLNIITDGRENDGLIDVSLLGEGADTGILTDPSIVRFDDVAEGGSATEVIRVANTGTAEASVVESCLDVDGDDECDGLCTASADDATLGGTLSCEVKKSGGAHEGKGFVLDASDAQAGGGDERTVEIHWSPTAEDPAIPAITRLLLKSNIENNTIFEVGVVGANAGVLEVTSTTPCGPNQCVQAEGDTENVTTWVGSTTLTLQNTGAATLVIDGIDFEAGTASTIADDWTIGAPADDSIAPGGSTTVEVAYANLDCDPAPCTPTDFSGQDGVNLIVSHNGAIGSTLVSLRVLPPQ